MIFAVLVLVFTISVFIVSIFAIFAIITVFAIFIFTIVDFITISSEQEAVELGNVELLVSKILLVEVELVLKGVLVDDFGICEIFGRLVVVVELFCDGLTICLLLFW